MPREKGFWVGHVPPDMVKKLEALKELGFDYEVVFRRALKYLFEEGVEACAKKLIQDRLEKLGLVEKEAE